MTLWSFAVLFVHLYYTRKHMHTRALAHTSWMYIAADGLKTAGGGKTPRNAAMHCSKVGNTKTTRQFILDMEAMEQRRC